MLCSRQEKHDETCKCLTFIHSRYARGLLRSYRCYWKKSNYLTCTWQQILCSICI